MSAIGHLNGAKGAAPLSALLEIAIFSTDRSEGKLGGS